MPGIYLQRNNNGYRYYNAVYTAPATATNGSIVRVYNDNFNGDISTTLSYQSTGTYHLTSTTGIFNINTTSLFFTNIYKASDIVPSVIIWDIEDVNTINIRTYRSSTGVLHNTGFTLNMELRIYYNYVIGT